MSTMEFCDSFDLVGVGWTARSEFGRNPKSEDSCASFVLSPEKVAGCIS